MSLAPLKIVRRALAVRTVRDELAVGRDLGVWLMTRRVAWLLVGIGTFGHALDAVGQTRTGRG